MALKHMVDMALSDEEKVEDMMPHDAEMSRDYPVGCSFTLTDRECEKLDLDTDGVEQGDYLELRVLARVRGFNKSEHGERLDMQIIAMRCIEDESTEAEPDEDEE